MYSVAKSVKLWTRNFHPLRFSDQSHVTVCGFSKILILFLREEGEMALFVVQ